MRFAKTMLVATVLAAGHAASAQPTAEAPGPPPPVAAPPCCLAPSGLPVEIELIQDVNSRTARPDDLFDIRLAKALVIDGRTIVPAGVLGRGQVVDSAPAGIAGRPGKLVLAARFVNFGPTRIPLRGFKLAGTGRDDSKTALVAYLAIGVVGLVPSGGNIDFPPGTIAMAKVAVDTLIPAQDSTGAPSAIAPSTGAPPPPPADGISAPQKEKVP